MNTIKRCLFCKKSTHNSKSIEHIIPESFGSKKKVLPKGIVCDSCNNYFSIKVEKPILSHASFRNIRAFNQVPNKKGKYPSLLGEVSGTDLKVSLKLDKNQNPLIQPEFEKDRPCYNSLFADKLENSTFRPLVFPVNIEPPSKEMSRLLAKMALEAMAYLNCKDSHWVDLLVDSSHYDLIRNYARCGMGVIEWPYFQRRIFPEETKMVHSETGKWVQVGFGHDILLTSLPETYFIFVYYGTEYTLNVGGPSTTGFEAWLKENNGQSPILKSMGVDLVQRNINGKIEFFLEPTKIHFT